MPILDIIMNMTRQMKCPPLLEVFSHLVKKKICNTWALQG